MRTNTGSKVGQQVWVAGIITLAVASGAQAGVPLNNLQGAGGAAFNPLAYTVGQNPGEKANGPLSNPQFGAWYVNLGDVDVDWTTIGVAETLFNRLELSYGYELIAPTGENIRKSNVGAKLNLIRENEGGNNAIPAISVGTIWKKTTSVAPGSGDSAFDYYAVATKLVTQLPKPVLLSAGVLETKEQVTGVFGYNDDYDTTVFGNVDVIPVSFAAIGAEYKQGASFSGFRNADYWDAHLVWFANKNLTLVGAYVNAGNEKSTSRVGLGDGVVVSAQYAF